MSETEILQSIQSKLTKRINFLLGKNGCGKSTLLRTLDGYLSDGEIGRKWFTVYINPERGGSLLSAEGAERDPNNAIDSGTYKSSLWPIKNSNRNDSFRQQSLGRLSILEKSVLAGNNGSTENRQDIFTGILDRINELLPLVKISKESAGFGIYTKVGNTKITPESISSGESEVIALAIDALAFSSEKQKMHYRLLLLDEPDVHLHPDLQCKLMVFLEKLAKESNFKILIATHSTAMISSVIDRDECQLAFMQLNKDEEIIFLPIDDLAKTLLPIFGAHPLSNVFQQQPVLLVEGDDDKRIWEQAVRSSTTKIPIYPCVVGTKDELGKWESWLATNLPSLYDAPRAYSLRDRDDTSDELADKGFVIRMRLGCRAAENMILCDDVLTKMNSSWDEVMAKCAEWLNRNPKHAKQKAMKSFKDSDFDRFNHDLKEIRHILLGDQILDQTKPWEVLVGQAIADVADKQCSIRGQHGLEKYLSEKVCREILKIQSHQIEKS